LTGVTGFGSEVLITNIPSGSTDRHVYMDIVCIQAGTIQIEGESKKPPRAYWGKKTKKEEGVKKQQKITPHGLADGGP
jgi:hypothetical protein